MNRFIYIGLASLLLSSPALAQNAPFTASQAYKDCTALTSSDANAALTKAEEWLKIDQGIGAHHCRAMALYGLKQYGPAAQELELVRKKMEPTQLDLRTYTAQQASRSWAAANKPEDAIRVLSEQINEITLSHGDNVKNGQLATQMLLDRSRIRADHGKYTDAVQDLDQAISLSPANESVLVQRAKVFTLLKDKGLAQQDLQAVLRINPKHEEALALMRVLRDSQ